jgi:hypothetical protein
VVLLGVLAVRHAQGQEPLGSLGWAGAGQEPGLDQCSHGLVVGLLSGLLVTCPLRDVLGAVAVLNGADDVAHGDLVVLDYVDSAEGASSVLASRSR